MSIYLIVKHVLKHKIRMSRIYALSYYDVIHSRIFLLL